jgi:hypothetical protein
MKTETNVMNSTTVKQFCRDKLGLSVRASTTPTKHRWITAWIPSIGDHYEALRYSSKFPETFRRICMRTVYGNTLVGNQDSGGNIGCHSVSMLPHEWEKVINSYLF